MEHTERNKMVTETAEIASASRCGGSRGQWRRVLTGVLGAALLPPSLGFVLAQTTGGNDNTTPLIEIESGEEVYERACAACHGENGRGAPQSRVGFDTPLPDFTDCSFATREPNVDWIAVAHQGGPARAFSKLMPAFGDALSEDQLEAAVNYIRGFCKSDSWPRGEFNLPRPLVTSKAYLEDEAVITTTVNTEEPGGVMNEFVYEQRFGARNQFEISIPFGWQEVPGSGIGDNGDWRSGIGDVKVGLKRALYDDLDTGAMVSLSGEVVLPTGDRQTGFGKDTIIFEPSLTYGQILPASAFIQAQVGAELPFETSKAQEELFWRGVLGRSFQEENWGRVWTPMVEVLAARELESGATTHWDLLPQMQVTLSKRQHIMLNAGVRVPLNDRSGRNTQFMIYVLWDWFDGGLTEGW